MVNDFKFVPPPKKSVLNHPVFEVLNVWEVGAARLGRDLSSVSVYDTMNKILPSLGRTLLAVVNGHRFVVKADLRGGYVIAFRFYRDGYVIVMAIVIAKFVSAMSNHAWDCHWSCARYCERD